jgi:hypothetical protein
MNMRADFIINTVIIFALTRVTHFYCLRLDALKKPHHHCRIVIVIPMLTTLFLKFLESCHQARTIKRVKRMEYRDGARVGQDMRKAFAYFKTDTRIFPHLHLAPIVDVTNLLICPFSPCHQLSVLVHHLDRVFCTPLDRRDCNCRSPSV